MSDRPRESASYSDPVSLALKLTGLAMLAVGTLFGGLLAFQVIPVYGSILHQMQMEYTGAAWIFGVARTTLGAVWAVAFTLAVAVIAATWKQRRGGTIVLATGLLYLTIGFGGISYVVLVLHGIIARMAMS